MVFGIAAGIWKPRHIECVENREAAFAKRMSDWSLGVMLLIRTLGVFFQSSGGGAVMLSCFAIDASLFVAC